MVVRPVAEKGSTEGAKKIDLSLKDDAKGTVRYCQGKDTAGDAKDWVKTFNAKNTGVTVELVEFSPDAGQQRQSFVQRQEAKSGDCDMFSSDVIWTAEFASQKWLYDMTEYVEAKKDQYIPATLATITYDGKVWGSPRTSDAAFLYYRTDQVKAVPATWQDVYKEAAANDGIVYQGAAYEGLTCDFLEIAFAAGGKVLSEDGTKAEFDSPENLKALQFMVDGIKDGAAPKAVTTYMEEQARMAFEAGRATFQRNWPYAYATAKKNKKAPDFEVARVPGVRGRGQGRHPRRPQRRHLGLRQEPGWRAEGARLPLLGRGGRHPGERVLAAARDRVGVRRSGSQEGAPVRGRAQAGDLPGEASPGLAGLPADLRGDLQERQRGPVGRRFA